MRHAFVFALAFVFPLAVLVAGGAACDAGALGAADAAITAADVPAAPDAALAAETAAADATPETSQDETLAEPEGHSHGTGELAAHVHGLAFYRGSKEIVVGTHEGTWRTEAGQSALVRLATTGDFMGFIGDPHTPDRLWSSGHNGASGYPNWGWIESLDGGATWTPITLGPTVDFHLTAASRDAVDVVAGLYGGTLYFSTDAGRHWTQYAWSEPASALEIASPTGPVFLIASATGIQRVTAPAMTANRLVTADVSAVAHWGAGIVYGTSNGKVFLCDADAANCTERAGPRGQKVLRFLVDPDDRDRLHALDAGSGVFHSDDAGASWMAVIGGH
jgi:hypothetical protein